MRLAFASVSYSLRERLRVGLRCAWFPSHLCPAMIELKGPVVASKKTSVVRFFVQAPDGRRSAEWRVWTGKGNNISDELYATPRDRAEHFKFSLHSNGYSQFGFSASVRERLRPGDQDAIAKWKRSGSEIVPGWRASLVLQFPASQLRHPTEAPSKNAVAVHTDAVPGTTTFITLGVGGPGVQADGLDLVGLLDRRNGGHVAVIYQTLSIDVEDKLSIAARALGRIPLVIPGVALDQPFDWFVDCMRDGTRAVTEFSVEPTDENAPLPSLPGFTGQVRRWNHGPGEFRHLELACAVFVYRADGRTELFVDQHSRCDHSELGRDAGRLVRQVEDNNMDEEWGHLAGGDLYSLISTRRVLEEAGITRGIPIKNV